jgi:hypothetical protein
MTTTASAPAKIDVGAVISRVFDTYGKTFSTLIPAAIILFLPVALLAALVAGSATGGLLVSLVSLVASAWYAGLVVRTVQDVQDGRVDASLGELFRSVTAVIWPLILVGLVMAICVVIGLILFIIPGLILLTIWAVAAPVMVVERPGVLGALGRSRELVRGNGWQVFAVIVVIFVLILVVSIIISSIGAIGDSFFFAFLVQLLLNVALAPIWALAAAVLFFMLREAHGQPVQLDAATGGFAPPQPPAGIPSAPPTATQPPQAPAAPDPPAPPTAPPAA